MYPWKYSRTMQHGRLRAVPVALLILAAGLAALAPAVEAQTSSFTPPTAKFTWGPEKPAALQDIRFIDQTERGTKGIQLWEWDFGDGRIYRSRVVANVTHNYTQPGQYQVTLTVYDRALLTDTETKTITVLPALRPDVKVAQEGPLVRVDARASSSPNGDVVSYSWNWGDGTPNGTGATATHAYAQPGTYTIKLTVTDSVGAAGYVRHVVSLTEDPPVADVRMEPAKPLVGQPVRFADASRAGFHPIGTRTWFVDGEQAGPGAALSRTFDAPGWHNVTLQVADARGQADEATLAFRVMAPPTAALNVSVDGRRVTASGEAADADGRVARLSWDWGDGAVPAEGPAATHEYLAAGTYNVTLTATDDDGLTATATRVVEILGRPVTVAFDVAPQPAVAGHEVRLTDGSLDPEGPLQRWVWDLGDGTVAEGPEVVKVYAAAGRYEVNLTVTDSMGGLARASRMVVVEAPPPPPTRAPTPVPTTPGGVVPTTTPTGDMPPAAAGSVKVPTGDVGRTGAPTPAPAPSPAKEVPGAGLAALVLAAAAALAVLRRR